MAEVGEAYLVVAEGVDSRHDGQRGCWNRRQGLYGIE